MGVAAEFGVRQALRLCQWERVDSVDGRYSVWRASSKSMSKVSSSSASGHKYKNLVTTMELVFDGDLLVLRGSMSQIHSFNLLIWPNEEYTVALKMKRGESCWETASGFIQCRRITTHVRVVIAAMR